MQKLHIISFESLSNYRNNGINSGRNPDAQAEIFAFQERLGDRFFSLGRKRPVPMRGVGTTTRRFCVAGKETLFEAEFKNLLSYQSLLQFTAAGEESVLSRDLTTFLEGFEEERNQVKLDYRGRIGDLTIKGAILRYELPTNFDPSTFNSIKDIQAQLEAPIPFLLDDYLFEEDC
jgi:hypothetical protein